MRKLALPSQNFSFHSSNIRSAHIRCDETIPGHTDCLIRASQGSVGEGGAIHTTTMVSLCIRSQHSVSNSNKSITSCSCSLPLKAGHCSSPPPLLIPYPTNFSETWPGPQAQLVYRHKSLAQ